MTKSSIKVDFPYDIHKIWEIITNVKDYSWRSDLSRTEVLNKKQFVEYTKDDYATTFTITVSEPYKRWEFDMENSNMKGHWTGIFQQKGTKTEVIFVEEVSAKKIFMKPFVKPYLKKQQAQFVSDLQQRLSRE